jgi:hypothetical protein
VGDEQDAAEDDGKGAASFERQALSHELRA